VSARCFFSAANAASRLRGGACHDSISQTNSMKGSAGGDGSFP
jgi:hypothetical protein